MQSWKESLAKKTESLKKVGRRQAEKVMQKLGAHSGTNDPKVTAQLEEVAVVQEHMQEMHDSISEYLVAVQRMQAAQLRVSSAVSHIVPLHTDDEDTKDVAEEWCERVNQLHDWHRAVLQPCSVETVIRPLGEKLRQFPVLSGKVVTRESKILDYDAYRSRMNAETAKNPESESALKLATKLDRARESMDTATSDVVSMCRDIQSHNDEVILRAFSSFAACQAAGAARQAEKIAPLLPGLPRGARAMCMVCAHAKTRNQEDEWEGGGDGSIGGRDGVKVAVRESNVLNVG